MFNEEIELLLTTLKVAFAFLFYEGDEETFIVYSEMDKDNALSGDDEVIGCVSYCDFDIYSKTNYTTIMNNLIDLMVSAGWTYQPSRDSPDMYERDTKYYHKTLCFAKEREI